MNLANAGIYLWLILYQIGEPIRDTVELKRTWFDFDMVEHCTTYADESYFIWEMLMDNPGSDWVFALCLNPITGDRTYILPTYAMTPSNPTGETPLEQKDVITSFEYSIANDVLPSVTGLNVIPDKKVIFKSWN